MSSSCPSLFTLAVDQSPLHPRAKELIDPIDLVQSLHSAEEAHRIMTTSNIKGRLNFDRSNRDINADYQSNTKLSYDQFTDWMTNKLTGDAKLQFVDDSSCVVRMDSIIFPEFWIEVHFTKTEWNLATSGEEVELQHKTKGRVSSVSVKQRYPLVARVNNYILRIDSLDDPAVWIEMDVRKVGTE